MTADFDFDRFCRALAREAPDAVIFADRDGVIRFWNAGAERIFGFSAADAIGKSLNLIIPDDLRERHWSGFRKTIHSGKTRYGAGNTLAVRALRKDGRTVPVEFSMLPLRDENGAIFGIGAILRDVRERVGVSGAHDDWMNL